MKVVSKKTESQRGKLGMKELGFSLIEVTISIAITAVALVSLRGMLPAGMKTMREAGDRAVETRIHQQILGEIQLTEWDDRENYDSSKSGIWFYDDQGIRIFKTGASADPDFEFTHVYSARISAPKVGESLPKSVGGAAYSGLIVPGDTTSTPDPNLQLVIVEITSVIDSDMESSAGFDKANFQNSIRSFQSTIAKMDK